MVHIEVETTINRPAEEIFAYASDIDRQPEWVSPLTESVKTSDGPTGIGTTYRQTAKFMGRRIEMNCEITGYEPPSLYGFSAKNGPMRMEMRFTLTPDGPDSTKLTQVAEGESSGFFKLADPILARSMRKQFEADLETLKTILESELATEAVPS